MYECCKQEIRFANREIRRTLLRMIEKRLVGEIDARLCRGVYHSRADREIAEALQRLLDECRDAFGPNPS